jgi:F-type H+-transporting ATPase subunit delta
MARITGGKRYARAAFELALERKELESWRASLSKIADMVKDEKLLVLLEDPRLPFAAKKTLIAERLGEINPLALNLAYLLARKKKLSILPEIVEEYQKLLDSHHGIEHVEVVTALPLDEQDKERLSTYLSKIRGHKVAIDVKVDRSIIGGIRAKIGDILIDGSLRQRLETLKRSLIEVSK